MVKWTHIKDSLPDQFGGIYKIKLADGTESFAFYTRTMGGKNYWLFSGNSDEVEDWSLYNENVYKD